MFNESFSLKMGHGPCICLFLFLTNVLCNSCFRLVCRKSLSFFSHLVIIYFFFPTFDNSIITLGSTNITCNHTFVTFKGSLFFFLTFDYSIVTLDCTKITYDCTFATFGYTLIFFLKFDSSIITFGRTNITCDHTFVIFDGSFFFFSHLMIP